MGYSTTVIASLVAEQVITCLQDRSENCDRYGDGGETLPSNSWNVNGVSYFFEETRKDQENGGVKGQVWRDHPTMPGHCTPAGTVHIDGKGRIYRFPCTTKAIRRVAEAVAVAEFIRLYGSEQAEIEELDKIFTLA